MYKFTIKTPFHTQVIETSPLLHIKTLLSGLPCLIIAIRLSLFGKILPWKKGIPCRETKKNQKAQGWALWFILVIYPQEMATRTTEVQGHVLIHGI